MRVCGEFPQEKIFLPHDLIFGGKKYIIEKKKRCDGNITAKNPVKEKARRWAESALRRNAFVTAPERSLNAYA